MVDQLERAVQCEQETVGSGNIIEIGGTKTVTPLEQSQMIFAAAGVEPRYVRVPLALLDVIENALCSVEAALLALGELFGIKALDRSLEAITNAAESVKRAEEISEEDLGLPASSLLASRMFRGGLPLLASTTGCAAFLSKHLTSTAELPSPFSVTTVLSANLPDLSADLMHHTWM
jgi:hypothetical protein